MRKNILFISNKSAFSSDSYGGAESSMRLLAESLSEFNNIYYLTLTRNKSKIPFLHSNILSKNVYIRFINAPSYLYKLPFFENFLQAYFNIVAYFFAAANDIQIVYTTYDLMSFKASVSIKQKLKAIKIVIRMAGLSWHFNSIKSKNTCTQYSKLFDFVDLFNFISEGLFYKCADLYPFKDLGSKLYDHCFIGDIGTNALLYSPKSVEYLDSTCFNLVMISRFSFTQKRQDILIDAIKLLPSALNVKLILVGDGPNRLNLQNYVQKLDLTDKIIFSSFLPQYSAWDLMGLRFGLSVYRT